MAYFRRSRRSWTFSLFIRLVRCFSTVFGLTQRISAIWFVERPWAPAASACTVFFLRVLKRPLHSLSVCNVEHEALVPFDLALPVPARRGGDPHIQDRSVAATEPGLKILDGPRFFDCVQKPLTVARLGIKVPRGGTCTICPAYHPGGTGVRTHGRSQPIRRRVKPGRMFIEETEPYVVVPVVRVVVAIRGNQYYLLTTGFQNISNRDIDPCGNRFPHLPRRIKLPCLYRFQCRLIQDAVSG
jgi:hypothetical protein